MDKSSASAIGPITSTKVEGMSSGPAASFVRMACIAVPSSGMVKGDRQDSTAVGSCSAFRTLCFIEREPIHSCVLLNAGVDFSDLRQKRSTIVDQAGLGLL